MAKQTLKMGGKTLIDPLSLVDVGIAPGSEASIDVLVAP